jgi:hypothetical protein
MAFAAHRMNRQPVETQLPPPEQTVPVSIEPLMGAVAPKVELPPKQGNFTTGIVAPPEVKQGEVERWTAGKPSLPIREEMGDVAVETQPVAQHELGRVRIGQIAREPAVSTTGSHDLSANEEIGISDRSNESSADDRHR